jgi:hypothetical protein
MVALGVGAGAELALGRNLVYVALLVAAMSIDYPSTILWMGAYRVETQARPVG